jgi:hypothetical protein
MENQRKVLWSVCSTPMAAQAKSWVAPIKPVVLTLDLDTVQDGIVDLQIDGGPGHRDYLEMPVQAGQVKLDEVVSLPLSLVLVGLLVSVRRRSD